MHEASNPVKSLKTMERVIEALASLEGASVSEIAKEIDRPPSIVHNHLDTLRELEYVVARDGEYYLGLKFLHRGEKARYRLPLYDAARKEIAKLAAESGELITLLVEEHGKGVYLDINSGSEAIDYPAKPGERTLLHCSAVGKAVLAHMSKSKVERIVDYYGLPPQSENTITSREQLFEELSEIRSTGISYDREEFRSGLKSVGAPITAASDTVVGSLSIAGPTHRMNDDRVEDDLRPLLMQSINVIELNLSEPTIQ
ncbi:transcriptional regulator, IclR family (plasmid) [Haloterrigena turkmenica DSM 5511]|uniref:Transcriptional regulator, IclR family n=1 Tax=Haloterrigena turkmenica (strain ATCC 51198 / DSM 5511 / JCM 9101 / NCIMB 13204 / VKM B-1734 / 4k) TaxID=543526 RepID=D2S2D4_HALTV|nr:IclR family transcriptional regulator [Haloterrigena turkmenica]ADB63531.1 transcriptional regulator, IclR family [Haloterrigena turkmenica DSM 5511]